MTSTLGGHNAMNAKNLVRAAVAAVCVLLIAPSGVAAQTLSELRSQLKKAAEASLKGTYQLAPFNCHDPWNAGNDNIVSALPPWAEAEGLRLGDKLHLIGGTSTAGPDGWVKAMRALPRGLSRFEVEVLRDGGPKVLQIPCRSHLPYYEAERRMWMTTSKGDWTGCISAAKDTMQAFGARQSQGLLWAARCANASGQDSQQKQVPSLLYEGGVALIHEMSAYGDAEQAPARAEIQDIIQGLEAHGAATAASDLRAQLYGQPSPKSLGSIPGHAGSGSFAGSGFVITPDGLLMTALHVVDGATRITAKCGTAPETPVTLVSKSTTLDLAVLRLSVVGTVAHLDFAQDAEMPDLGARVFTVGFPLTDILGGDLKYTDGTISSVSGLDGDASFYQVSVPIQPGNSGGPLIDERGHVVGVVLATAAAPAFLKATGNLPQNINWAVKARVATTLFKVPPPTLAAISREDAIKRATAAACFIVASKN